MIKMQIKDQKSHLFVAGETSCSVIPTSVSSLIILTIIKITQQLQHNVLCIPNPTPPKKPQNLVCYVIIQIQK